MNLKALIRKAKAEVPEGRGDERAEKAEEEDRQELRLQNFQSFDSRHFIKSLEAVLLLEDFVTAEYESGMLALLRARSKDFVQLRTKRTARFGGDPGPPFLPEPLPNFLQPLCAAVAQSSTKVLGAPCPNHVLVNHYQPGEGIMPHTDGPAYYPFAAILSLGSAVVFEFWRDHAHSVSGLPPALSLLLPPRSLLLFSHEAYSKHLHGIAARNEDELHNVENWTAELAERSSRERWGKAQLESRGALSTSSLRRCERYSLTIRHVAEAS